MNNEGWICPKCGRVWAPFWPSCSECNAGKRSPFAGHDNPKTTTSGALIMLDGDEPEPADAGEGGGWAAPSDNRQTCCSPTTKCGVSVRPSLVKRGASGTSTATSYETQSPRPCG